MIEYIILIAYFIVTIFLGLVATRKPEQTPEDFFLASRKLNLIKIFFTLIATNFSAFFFLGFAGEGYRIGYAYYPMMAFGTSFAALTFYIIGNKSWKLGKIKGYITPVELIGDISGSKFLRFTFMAVMLFFMIPFLAIQPIGAGLILEQLTHGQIPYGYGASLLTVFILAYILIGGMRSIATMDLKNGIILIVFMTVAAIAISFDLGGISATNKTLSMSSAELFNSKGAGSAYPIQKWISYLILWFCCLPMFPQLFLRFFMAKDIKTFQTTTLLYTLVPPFLFVFPVMIGVLGHVSFPDLVGKEADRILPMMLGKHSPTWIGALVLTGALAAFMSTMDSVLLALSTILSRDLYVPLIKKDASLKSQVTVGKIFVMIIAGISLLIALERPASIFIIATMTFSGSAILFPTTVAVLHWKRVNPTACAISIFAGVITVFAFGFKWISPEYLNGFLPVIPGLIIACLIIVIGTMIKQKEAASY